MTDTIRVRGALPGERRASDVLLAGGRVARISRAGRGVTEIGGGDAQLFPVLFDIQVNGGWGIDLQHADFSPEDIGELSRRLAARGVGRWVPTIITNSAGVMERACAILGEAMRDRLVRRRVPGIHVEGPFISPEDGARGAHARKHVRKPSLRELDRWLAATDGRVLCVTVAPEAPGAAAFIRGCVKRGVTVSLGHHQASAEQIHRAADTGATLCTHLGNGMSATIDRHFNPLWPQLAEDRLSASLLADGHHLPPEVMQVFVRAKGAERIVLTSDATHLAGMKPGHYDLAGVPVELKRNGRICLSGTNLLAGSAQMLIDGVFNAWRLAGMTLEEAFASASTAPAKLLGVRYPALEVREGKRANFLVVDVRDAARPQLLASVIDGEVIRAD